MRGQIQQAMNRLAQDHRLTRVNLTDNDAQLMKGRQGIIPGYNAQAMASPVVHSSANGMLITAADVVTSAADSGQLVTMLKQAEEMIGESVPVTLADGGYHTAANLAAGEQRGDLFVMPERYHPGVQGPYFKDKFVYDPATDNHRPSGIRNHYDVILVLDDHRFFRSGKPVRSELSPQPCFKLNTGPASHPV